MRRPKGVKLHTCSPQEWRTVPNLTGDYDLDGAIMRRTNRDMPERLNQHLTNSGDAYGQISAYNGYRGYHGDN
jgi:hypothetical protein